MIKFLILFLLPFASLGQPYDSPLEYMEALNSAYRPVLMQQFDFSRAVAQGQPIENVQKQRQLLLSEIRNTQREIQAMPRYKGNAALRDSTLSFLDVTTNLVNEDFARIISLESSAENGLDEMESFLQAQQAAYARISKAATGVRKAEESFADQFGVRLVDSDDKFARKLEELNRTFNYYNRIYIVFFRAYQQESALFEAIEKQSVEDMQLERRKLEVAANEGLAQLNRTGSYQGDRSLRTAAVQNLEFYQKESRQEVVEIIDYYKGLAELQTMKATLGNSGIGREERSELTKEYNAMVKEVNESTPQLNALNENLNRDRVYRLNSWNKVSEAFLQKFIN